MNCSLSLLFVHIRDPIFLFFIIIYVLFFIVFIFRMEKLTSALYLGEIARLCLYKLASTGAILNGYASPALSTNGSLKTVDLALMEMQVDS